MAALSVLMPLTKQLYADLLKYFYPIVARVYFQGMADEEKHRGRELLELATRDEVEDTHGDEGLNKEAEDHELADAVKKDAMSRLVKRLTVM